MDGSAGDQYSAVAAVDAVSDFPRKHNGAFFKVKRHTERPKKGVTARRRASKSRARKAAELEHMRQVRSEDGHCRFPRCGCVAESVRGHLWSIWLKPEVAHTTHRGMAGNPAGDRSQPERLITVCNWRHKIAKFSIDKKTLRVEPLTDRGLRGPVQWWIHVAQLVEWLGAEVVISDWRISPAQESWYPLATETAPHVCEPFTEAQAAILQRLASMEC